jgi:hypothetical protein
MFAVYNGIKECGTQMKFPLRVIVLTTPENKQPVKRESEVEHEQGEPPCYFSYARIL